MLTSRAIAQAAAIERLLNSYLRETENFTPALEPDHPALKLLPEPILREIKEQGIPFRIELKATGVIIVGALTYWSPFGHHRYGTSFWGSVTPVDGREGGDYSRLGNCRILAELILNEIAVNNSLTDTGNDRVSSMLEQIENSIRKTEIYVERRLTRERSLWRLCGKERTFTAEQSLTCGHPFHPTPKSSQGFLPDHLTRYAPEMGAAFSLHYLAVAPELVEEAFLTKTDAELLPSEVLEAANRRLTPEKENYRLLPCHPWQAEHLKGWPEVQELLRTGRLVDLGELGDKVYPTSSVRTVWDFGHQYIFKLPLNVRITNFVRVNPPEQLKRTMDASRAIAHVRDQIPYADFTIMLEEGYRTVRLEGVSPDRQQKLAESAAVIFRENPMYCSADNDNVEGTEAPTVVAALLEQPPFEKEAPVWEAVRMAAESEKSVPDSLFVNKWLRRYLEISFVPILWLFLEHGISMEAHVQNSMVTIQNGWPVRFYVRDLEGVSISRERALEQNLVGKLLAEDSPALYPDHEAWHRFKYYVLVNHLGHLIHTVAYYGQVDELGLWQVAGEVLHTSGLFDTRDRKRYLLDLLENEGLPAKANFVSCFQKRGETPLYVNIANPLTKCGVKV
ncbi:IucA/IucC family protein [Effusibacillus consociatus]|uniref:IucA/IucC family protein n=1 Tax=Effusibacillus consociatus TaxID=1117041 RepID=A0ABV9PXC1_9BACL